MTYRIEYIGWKAWYKDGKIYRSTKNKWKNLPRDGLVGLKRFFRLIDEDDNYKVDEESGKSIYYELLIGHKMITISMDELMKNRRIPKLIKFGAVLSQEQFEEAHKTLEEDQEEPFSVT